MLADSSHDAANIHLICFEMRCCLLWNIVYCDYDFELFYRLRIKHKYYIWSSESVKLWRKSNYDLDLR